MLELFSIAFVGAAHICIFVGIAMATWHMFGLLRGGLKRYIPPYMHFFGLLLINRLFVNEGASKHVTPF
jgi:hypothetical protein